MKKFKLFGLAFLSGILLSAAWPVSPLTFLIFIALIPLLYLADIVQNKKLFFLLAYLALLAWNVLATWWVWNSTDVGSIAAFMANALLMYLPWWGYRVCKRKWGQRLGYVSLVLFWMSFEYIHLNWQLSWPWLTLGNVFASNPGWVQWYEYTGTSGGTLWVLIVNILIYKFVSTKYEETGTKYEVRSTKQNSPLTTHHSPLTAHDSRFTIHHSTFTIHRLRQLIPVAIAIIVPFLLSVIVTPGDSGKGKYPEAKVLIIQPNIDPYGKNDPNSINEQVDTLLALTTQNIDSTTKLVVWPETALSAEWVFDDRLYSYAQYKPVFQFVQQHPGVTLLTGIQLFKNYGTVKQTNSAIAYSDGLGYFDAFNAAVALKQGVSPVFYHKSKLVPGVETLPDFLKWMAPIFEKFGGTTGGYGTQPESSIMQQPGQLFVTAPIICYESIYGEYVSTYVNKGANLLVIMTNDGWWGNTPGHKQHLNYARLRAIETRRWVARSANTGVSAVIDSKGNILETRPWAQSAVLQYSIPALTGETFYVRYGDILSKIALVLGAVLLAWHVFTFVRGRFVK